jgi:hypothetical protein
MAPKKSSSGSGTTIDIPLMGGSSVPTTDLAKIEADPNVSPVLSKAQELLTFAQSLQVTDERTAQQAVEVLSAAKQAKNSMESARKMFTGPLDRHVKSINAWFKSKLAPVTEADTLVRKKLGDYQAEQERVLREEQERRRKEQEEAYRKQLADAKKNKTEPAPLPVVAEDTTPRAATFSTHGMARTRSLGWTYEVLDITKVPAEFKVEIVNEELVKEAIEAGARGKDIDGLNIYERTTLAVY